MRDIRTVYVVNLNRVTTQNNMKNTHILTNTTSCVSLMFVETEKRSSSKLYQRHSSLPCSFFNMAIFGRMRI